MSGEAGGDRLWIPSWDGDPSKWIEYRQELRLYQLGKNMEVSYCIASRLVGRLRGAARRVGLAMETDDLFPPLIVASDASDQAVRVARGERNNKGIAALVAKLEKELGQQKPQRKGERLDTCFNS